MNKKKIYIWISLLFMYYNISGQFTGGNQDGYAHSSFISSTTISQGGSSDGYDFSISNSLKSFSRGAVGDGYDHVYNTSSESFSLGGPNDGYDQFDFFPSFIWSGSISTDWNTNANWNMNAKPGIRSMVIIPANANFFPRLQNGLLSIGKVNAPATFTCASLQINPNAEVFLEFNGAIENYGVIQIAGRLYFLDQSAHSVMNIFPGVIRILNGGTLKFVN